MAYTRKVHRGGMKFCLGGLCSSGAATAAVEPKAAPKRNNTTKKTGMTVRTAETAARTAARDLTNAKNSVEELSNNITNASKPMTRKAARNAAKAKRSAERAAAAAAKLPAREARKAEALKLGREAYDKMYKDLIDNGMPEKIARDTALAHAKVVGSTHILGTPL